MSEKFKSTHIRLTEKQYNQLRRESFDTKKSLAEIIREALEMRWKALKKEEKIMRKPEWISEDTRVDTTNHHVAEVWIEEHQNPETGETVYLVCDTSGSNYGLGICGLVGVYDSFEDASNRIGDEYGYDEFWKKF